MSEPIVEVDLRHLQLDPENPRLPPDVQGSTQKKILEHIARYEAVEDLMAAIGRNGFFPGEPLVVYHHRNDPEDTFRVIEGNRRLASVLLLNDPEAYKARPSLAEIAEDAKHTPKKLPVIAVPNREAALPYLGSRHIVGVKSWEPLQKARYMLQLFKATGKSSAPAARYREVASRIGSGNRRDYIRKNLDALAIYNVIKAEDYYGDEKTTDLSFSFGVLYTALDYRPIAGFLGSIDYDAKKDQAKENDPIANPQTLKKKNIEEFYSWCFRKSEGGKTVLGESRNLSKLAAVLKSAKATETLRKSKNLELAYEQSEGVADELAEALGEALKQLRYANSIVANVKHTQGLEDLARSVRDQAKQVLQSLAAKTDEDGD